PATDHAPPATDHQPPVNAPSSRQTEERERRHEIARHLITDEPKERITNGEKQQKTYVCIHCGAGDRKREQDSADDRDSGFGNECLLIEDEAPRQGEERVNAPPTSNPK